MTPTKQTEVMTVKRSLLELFEQHRRWTLFFGTGTSCDLHADFGMGALQAHLTKELGAHPEWRRVDEALQAGNTLEQALDGADTGLSSEAKSLFRSTTGNHVASVDRRFRDEVLVGTKQWVGASIIKTLLDRLPATNPRLPIITSNYDMLIEYACSAQRIRWTTGFVGGVSRSWAWQEAQGGLLRVGGGIRPECSLIPRVELMKVHGSINRFTRGGERYECDLWSEAAPDGFERDIAIPGSQKYQQYAESNADTGYQARQAVDNTQGYMMIGYGFNDHHLHDNILERSRLDNRPLLFLTWDLAPEAINQLRVNSNNTWILLAGQREDESIDPSKTRVYHPSRENPVIIDDQLWNCDAFTKQILGG